MKRAFLVLVGLAVIAAAGVGLHALQADERAVQGLSTAPSSSSPSSRAAARARSASGSIEAGVVRDDVTFRAALWRTGRARSLQAGEFRFDRPMTPTDVDREDRARRRLQPPHHVSRRADHPGDGAHLRAAGVRQGGGVRRGGARCERDSRHRPGRDRSRGLSLSGNLLAAARHDSREAGAADGGALPAALHARRCSRPRRRSS